MTRRRDSDTRPSCPGRTPRPRPRVSGCGLPTGHGPPSVLHSGCGWGLGRRRKPSFLGTGLRSPWGRHLFKDLESRRLGFPNFSPISGAQQRADLLPVLILCASCAHRDRDVGRRGIELSWKPFGYMAYMAHGSGAGKRSCHKRGLQWRGARPPSKRGVPPGSASQACANWAAAGAASTSAWHARARGGVSPQGRLGPLRRGWGPRHGSRAPLIAGLHLREDPENSKPLFPSLMRSAGG